MRRSAARESSPPKRHFSSFVFSEGASPDAPIFFSAVRENRPQISRFFFSASLGGRISDAPFGCSGEQPSERSLPMCRLFSFRHLSEGASPDEPICYSCQFGCSGEQPSDEQPNPAS